MVWIAAMQRYNSLCIYNVFTITQTFSPSVQAPENDHLLYINKNDLSVDIRQQNTVQECTIHNNVEQVR